VQHKSSKTIEMYTTRNNEDIGKIKSPLDRLFGNRGKHVRRMGGSEIMDRVGSSRGMYMRSTSDILPKWKDIRSITTYRSYT